MKAEVRESNVALSARRRPAMCGSVHPVSLPPLTETVFIDRLRCLLRRRQVALYGQMLF